MRPPSQILIFGLNYPPETTGISPYTGAMASGLASRGRSVRALVAHPHYPDWKITSGYGQWSRQENIDGVWVTRLRHYVPAQPVLLRRALSEITLGLRQAMGRWGRPSTIVAVSPALFSSLCVRVRAMLTHRRTPFVIWVQDLYGLGVVETGQGGGKLAGALRAIEAWLLRSATTVVVIHDRFADRVHEDLGVPRDRIQVIRNWTHLSPLTPIDVRAVRASFGWGSDETIVVHTGNMGVKQGLHHVVDAGRLAAERSEKIRFVLIGNGAQRPELQRRIDEQATTTEILPPLDDDAYGAALQAADVLLVNELPGVSEMAVPSKLTSYFASGRPVLAATDKTGITAQEVHIADAGISVSAGDSGALLDGVQALVSDPKRSERLGRNGKHYRETVLDETFAINRFDSLLADLTAAARTDR